MQLTFNSNVDHQMTWMSSGRVHSEFEWYTIETENFNVHYHKDIESIAIAGANIAEEILPTLLKQVELDEIPIIDIILTTVGGSSISCVIPLPVELNPQ